MIELLWSSHHVMNYSNTAVMHAQKLEKNFMIRNIAK